jgi:hypothetical protein|nr:O-antigen polysaccharide polymerase Wzy [Bacteroides fluxus]
MKRLLCISFLSIFSFYLSFVYYDYDVYDLLFLVPNYCLSLFCLLNLFSKNEYEYSFNNIFYVFYYFFFGIAPAFQYMEKVNIWGGTLFTEEDYILTTIISLISLVIYRYLNHLFRKQSEKRMRQISNMNSNLYSSENVNSWVLVIISLLSFFVYFKLVDFDVLRLLIRGGDEIEMTSSSTSTSSYLLISKFIRPMSVASLLIFKMLDKKNIVVEVLLWLILLLANSPFGMARFSVAAFYMPILFLYSSKLKKKYNFSILLVFSILIVFPFLNQFRYWGEGDITIGFNFDMFLVGHFDSFQMFMRVIKEDIITYGRQLLGVLFFFFPRSLWPDKPIGSGHFVAGESNLYFDNVSMNFLGEGYLNAGFGGIILFLFFIAWFNAYMDTRFWKSDPNNIFKVNYYLLLGMEFVILRGQLMSFYPITIGYVCSTFFVYKISKIHFYTKSKSI